MPPAPPVSLVALMPLTTFLPLPAFTPLTALTTVMPFNCPVTIPASMIIPVDTLTTMSVIPVPSPVTGAVVVNLTAASRTPPRVSATVLHDALISPPLEADPLSLIIYSADAHTVDPLRAERVGEVIRVCPAQVHLLEPGAERSIIVPLDLIPLTTQSADAHAVEPLVRNEIRKLLGGHPAHVHPLEPATECSVVMPLDLVLLTVHAADAHAVEPVVRKICQLLGGHPARVHPLDPRSQRSVFLLDPRLKRLTVRGTPEFHLLAFAERFAGAIQQIVRTRPKKQCLALVACQDEVPELDLFYSGIRKLGCHSSRDVGRKLLSLDFGLFRLLREGRADT